MKTAIRHSLPLALGLALLTTQGIAQTYPSKPVRVISTQQAGQGGDPLLRIVATKLASSLGQPFVVENNPGAGGTIATEQISTANPDGYNLLYATASSTVGVLYLFKNVRYDPVKGLTPIHAMGEVMTTMIASPQSGITTIPELIDRAKRNPGKLSYGTVGPGSTYHFLGETFKVETATDLLHVPYKGMGPMVNDVMAGRIEMSYLGMNQALPLHRQGKLRILAVIQKERYAKAPDIPTLQETLPKYEKPVSFFGLFGPANLPRPIVDRLHGEIARSLGTTEVRTAMDELTITPINNTPEEFAALIRRGIESSGAAAKAMGLKPE